MTSKGYITKNSANLTKYVAIYGLICMGCPSGGNHARTVRKVVVAICSEWASIWRGTGYVIQSLVACSHASILGMR